MDGRTLEVFHHSVVVRKMVGDDVFNLSSRKPIEKLDRISIASVAHNQRHPNLFSKGQRCNTRGSICNYVAHLPYEEQEVEYLKWHSHTPFNNSYLLRYGFPISLSLRPEIVPSRKQCKFRSLAVEHDAHAAIRSRFEFCSSTRYT